MQTAARVADRKAICCNWYHFGNSTPFTPGDAVLGRARMEGQIARTPTHWNAPEEGQNETKQGGKKNQVVLSCVTFSL